MDSETEQSESGEGSQSSEIHKSNGDISLTQKASATRFVITEEPHEEEEEEGGDEAHAEHDNDQYDDETASKGSRESKESDNEKVINTRYDNEKDSSLQAPQSQMLRRKSMAPPAHE